MATRPKRPRDTNKLAKLIVGISTGEIEDERPDEGKDPKRIESGRKGGLVGGKARVSKLSDEAKSAAARKAALARWKKD